jgi:hypothetical protein
MTKITTTKRKKPSPAPAERAEKIPYSYIMKNPSPENRGPVARMAEREGRSLRWVILELLQLYGKEGL